MTITIIILIGLQTIDTKNADLESMQCSFNQGIVEKILDESPDLVYMTKMQVILQMDDGRIVIISSDRGKYNKVTYDCYFEENVKATDGETIATLDGEIRILDSTDGGVADAENKAIGIAGVLGGSAVVDNCWFGNFHKKTNMLKIIKKDIREDARKAREKASDKKQEAALEKAKPKGGQGKGPKLNLPGKGLLSKIFGFFGAVILGRIAFLMVDWLPVITPWLKKLGGFVDGVIDWSGKILNGLVWFIDWSYKLYDAATGWIKEQLGEEGAEKFDTFMGNLHKLIQGFLVWKIIGEKIFKAIVQSIKNTWKIIKGAFVRAFKIAKAALKAAWNLVKNIPGVRQAAGWIGKQAGRLGGAIKGLGSRILGGATQGGAKVATKVGGLVAKWFGPAAKMIAPAAKAAKPFVTKFASRVPILGPIIVAVISLMSGEPLGQALFKGLGAALGGFLGTTAGIAITAALGVATAGIGALLGGLITPAMTILGELIGTFIGDLLYNLFLGGGLKDMMGKLKGMLIGGLKKVLAVGDFIKDFISGGFSRFYEGIPKFKVPDFPKDPPDWITSWVPWKEKLWKAATIGLKVMIGPLSLLMGKEIPNLLWLTNPVNTSMLMFKSFFPPSGEGESSSSPPPKDTLKGETEGKEPPKPKTNRLKVGLSWLSEGRDTLVQIHVMVQLCHGFGRTKSVCGCL